MPEPLSILLAEDDDSDAALIVLEIKRSGFDPSVRRVQTEAEFASGLKTPIDAVLVDYAMPSFEGIRALEMFKESGLEIPFILISGTIGEERAVEVMKLGATDYILKDRLGRLGIAMRQSQQKFKEHKQRLQMERQFIEAQKMEVVGQLASGVAHDFNNLIGVILGCTDLMSMKLSPEHELRGFVDTIHASAERAAGLTKQLLIFSRNETVRPVVLNINDAIKDLDKVLHRLIGENVELEIRRGAEIGHVKADTGYVGQVLMNLVVNARDAMPNGGKLTIATANVEVGEKPGNGLDGAPPGRCVMLSVADTGTGMTEVVKQNLFKAFFTTKPKGKGTGLGLTTCQSIMQQMGGYIGVESEPGRGTTFKVLFPCVDAKPDSRPSKISTGDTPRGTESVLVVEDDPSLRKLACQALECQGYKVISAANGRDALHSVRNHQGPPIRLVITDVIMPLMSGKVMAEWLKASYPDLKVLFTSGYMDDTVNSEGVPSAGVDFLPKPFTPRGLATKVREMLDTQ